jgi:hypothetical protein
VSCAWPLECHLLLAAEGREDPLEQPLDATPPSFFFLPRALSFPLCFPPARARRHPSSAAMAAA